MISNYSYLPVRIDPEQFGCSRDKVADTLADEKIFARKYFYPLTSQFPVIQKKFRIQDTPIAEIVSNQILCLPLYAGLDKADVDRICNVVLKANS